MLMRVPLKFYKDLWDFGNSKSVWKQALWNVSINIVFCINFGSGGNMMQLSVGILKIATESLFSCTLPNSPGQKQKTSIAGPSCD